MACLPCQQKGIQTVLSNDQAQAMVSGGGMLCYAVTFADGTIEQFSSYTDARIAQRQRGGVGPPREMRDGC